MHPENTETVSHIPAAPGWHVVEPVWDANGQTVIELGFTDILAWQIHREVMFTGKDGNPKHTTFVEPVTLVGVPDDWRVLRSPTGQFDEPYVQTFNGEADVLEYFRDVAASAQARRAAQ
jgi:hypothetical protein